MQPSDLATQIKPPTVSSPRSEWIALGAVASGVFLVALDGTITAVANPRLAEELHASLAQLQWVTNVYLLALGAVLILAGRMGDRFGKRGVFLVGIAGFALSSAAIGLSPSVELVIAARGAQGLFGALIVTNAISLLRSTFSLERLPSALSAFGAVIGSATAAGPIVGGVLVDLLSWRWAFIINLPLGIISLALGLAVLRETPRIRDQGFDLIGTVLLAFALVGISYALIRGSEHSWADPHVAVFAVVGVACGVLFVFQERRCPDPLLPFRMFSDRNVTLGVLLTLLTFVSLVGAMFFLLLFLQQVRGMTPMAAGLMLLPMSVMNVAGSLLAGVLTSRSGPRPALVGGMLLTAVGFYTLTWVRTDSELFGLVVPLAVLGLGLGLVMTASVQAVLANVEDVDAGAAGGLHQTATQVGGILGTSALGAVMAAAVQDRFGTQLQARDLDGRRLGVLDVESHALVAQGAVPTPGGAPAGTVELVQAAAHATFVSAMHTTMLVGAVIAVGGAVAAMWVTSNKTADADLVVH